MFALRSFLFVLLLVFLLGPFPSVPAQEDYGQEIFSAQVAGIRPGGMIQVTSHGKRWDLRLACIRLPEESSGAGRKAKELLTERLMGKFVEVHIWRYTGDGEIAEGYALFEGVDIRLELTEKGLARYCPGHPDEPALEKAEKAAKAGSLGIWSDQEKGVLPLCKP